MPRLAEFPLETGAAAPREDRMWRYNGGPPCIFPSFSKSRLFCSKLFQTNLWRFCGISMSYKVSKRPLMLPNFSPRAAPFRPHFA